MGFTGIMSSEKRSRKLKNLIRQRLAAYDKAPIHPSLKDYGQKIIMNGSNIFT